MASVEYGNDWENGICSCFNDCSICLMSFFCPCIQVYRNASAIPGGENGCLFLFGLCTPLYACGYDRASLRNDIRVHKEIHGSHFSDWFCVTCCPLLSLVQESQEMMSQYMLRE